jgi:hypothetical protein
MSTKGASPRVLRHSEARDFIRNTKSNVVESNLRPRHSQYPAEPARRSLRTCSALAVDQRREGRSKLPARAPGP